MYPMLEQTNPGKGWPAPRIPLSKNLTIEDIGRRNLCDFVTTASIAFFEVTGISQDFLSFDPSEWKLQASYTEGKSIVDGLQIVNDCAERGVGLIKECVTNPLVKDEEQLQALIKQIHSQREKLPTLNKKSEIVSFTS
ncbi:Polyhomeotic-like protein 1 [Frankliniella fusca]|uniref:Polyhomeotic-like protein 1 n=1 Tax=Frankliniella fusca TaxID=407009 RepID=A0AAE1HC04_9NEOP|nr:Polyhomeotic-like protein 1 [Frankliniella fusca]